MGLVGRLHDQRYRVALQVRDLAQVEDDVEVALGVDEVLQDDVDPRLVVEADLAMDGHDHSPAGAADGEP